MKGLRKNFSYNTYQSDTVNEFLFFDYDLQVNDTLTLPIVGFPNQQKSEHVILSIDSILINNTWHKTFLIEPISGFDNNNYTFIEGIGSTRYGLTMISEYLNSVPIYPYLPYMICFKNNGTSPLDDYSNCNHVTAINDLESKSYLHFYPNPANEEITIEYSGTKASEYNVSLLDLSGRVLLKTSFRSKTTLNTSKFLSGMYIIQMADESGVLVRDKIVVRK